MTGTEKPDEKRLTWNINSTGEVRYKLPWPCRPKEWINPTKWSKTTIEARWCCRCSRRKFSHAHELGDFVILKIVIKRQSHSNKGSWHRRNVELEWFIKSYAVSKGRRARLICRRRNFGRGNVLEISGHCARR